MSRTITAKQIEKEKRCENCFNSKTILDVDKGEQICENCGVIIEDKLDCSYVETKYSRKDLRTQNINRGMPSLLAFPDKGLSTIISNANVDAFGTSLNSKQITKIKRMRLLDKTSSFNKSQNRNLKNAFNVLYRIRDKLSLNEIIIEKAAYYYRKILDLRIIKGRSIKEFVVACVYTVCRELNIPRTLNEIAEVVNANKVFAGKCYRLLLKRLSIKLPSIDLSSHLAKIANKAQISKKSLQRALEMMAIIKNYPLSCGKDPAALSIAVLYGSCLEQGEKVNQRQIAFAGEMSVVTLRKRFLDIKKIFPYLPDSF